MQTKTLEQSTIYQKWRQTLNENLETLHLAPTLFYHLPVFFLNPHPLSLPIYYLTLNLQVAATISKPFDIMGENRIDH